MKIHRMSDGQYAFHCPGCECAHGVYIDGIDHPIWGWNQSLENPTFTPSIRVRWIEDGKEMCCHSYVTNGSIWFLNDSTHKLSGQTVEIPEWE